MGKQGLALQYSKNNDVKKIFITQSNYIPWKGYFDCINFVDEFIIYDEVQYTKRTGETQ